MQSALDGSRQQLPWVFVLGASVTIHFGPYLEKALEGYFTYDRKRADDGKRAEDNLDIAQGASGGDSGNVLAYLRHRRRHDPIPADILLLNCGLHDLKTDPRTGAKQVPPERFEANLREIVREVADMGLSLAWLRISPVVDEIHNARSIAFHRYSADVDHYNRIADRIMQEAGAYIIDFHAFCTRLLPQSLIDHIHYDLPARQAQAEFIAEQLKARFAKPI
jgi:hypothetical protein